MTLGISPDLPRTDDLTTTRPWLLKVLRPLGRLVFRRWWRTQSHGWSNVPAEGPVIFAANHVAVIDGPLLGFMVDRTAFTIAKTELFRGVVGRLLMLTGQIPVDRARPDPLAIRRCVRLLRDGGALIIYPEGVRGSGELAFARHGAAYLALVTGAPIVPVALLGTREPGQTISQVPGRGSTMHLVYGPPVPVPGQGWPRSRADVARWTEQIRVILAQHVQQAQDLTGVRLPGPPPPRHPTPSVVSRADTVPKHPESSKQ